MVIDATDMIVMPGFIDAHVHLESSLLVPESFQRTVLSRGTTTAICENARIAASRLTGGHARSSSSGGNSPCDSTKSWYESASKRSPSVSTIRSAS